MTLHADQKYDGTIARCVWMQAQSGTPGLQVDIETDDGDLIVHVFWVSKKSLGFFEERMVDFGIKPEQLRNGSFLENELPTALVGLAVSFGTKEETYKEQKRIKVAWIGSRKAPSDERGIGFAVAAMLGGEASESKPATKKVEPPLTDDDIPF